MTGNIFQIDDMGYFWWHGTNILEKQFAPNEAVTGKICLTEEKLTANLVGTLNAGPFAAFADRDVGALQGKAIQGKLLREGRYVLLGDLAKNGGGFSSQGINSEEYVALYSLDSNKLFESNWYEENYTGFDISLSGLEEWLAIRSIVFDRSEDGRVVSADYVPEEPIEYIVDGERIIIDSFLNSPSFSGKESSVVLKEEYICKIRFNRPYSFNELIRRYRSFHNLLLLLTGKLVRLNWPVIYKISGDSATLRFIRDVTDPSPVALYDCWVAFETIREKFGPIIYEWDKIEQRLGSAIYLLLGVKRRTSFYPEHKLSNIIWAIESFSRQQNDLISNEKIENQVRGIIEKCNIEKDRKFLRKKLRYAAEPSLEQRIISVLSGARLPVKRKSFNKFSKHCADVRNEIAHHGGPKQGSYEDFVQKIRIYTEALIDWYHLRLLVEIGIEHDAIVKIFLRGQKSIYMRFWFERAGLEILDDVSNR